MTAWIMRRFNPLPRPGVVLPDGSWRHQKMKLTPVVSSLLAAAALTACGSGGSLAEFRAAAPTSEKIAISEYDGDPVDGTAVADASSSTALGVARRASH